MYKNTVIHSVVNNKMFEDEILIINEKNGVGGRSLE